MTYASQKRHCQNVLDSNYLKLPGGDMGRLIRNKATTSFNSRQFLRVHPDELISSGQIFEGQICFEEPASSVLYKRFIVWSKLKLWCWIISPAFLLSSFIFYICAPLKITGEKFYMTFSKYLNINFKRILDIVAAIIGLILSSILFLILPILIRLDSKGPVFYTQIRVGQNRRRNNRRSIPVTIFQNRRNGDRRRDNNYGKLFVIYKFRTMREEAEKKSGPIWASANDPRVTSVGRFLRRFHLDELPQLINILKGDMSFVGPRPLPFKVEDKDRALYDNITQVPGYNLRRQAKPGLTGMAQVYAPKEIDHREKFQYDNMYLEQMSFWLDLKLILLSFWVTFRGRWEHRGKKI